MPAIATLTIATKTFSPAGIKGDIAMWENRESGILAAYPKLTASVIGPVGKSKLVKVRFKLTVPTMETLSNDTSSGIAPAPTKAFDSSVDLIFTFHERSSAAQRTAVHSYLNDITGALAATFSSKLITDLEPVY